MNNGSFQHKLGLVERVLPILQQRRAQIENIVIDHHIPQPAIKLRFPGHALPVTWEKIGEKQDSRGHAEFFDAILHGVRLLREVRHA